MSLAVEQYAEYLADAEMLWAVVGAPQRLPEWTGLGTPTVRGDAPDAPGDEPLLAWEEGAHAVVEDGGVRRAVVVVTARRGVVEVTTDTECGMVGIGVRVVADANRPATSRVVIAGRLEEPRGALRARAVDLPRLRRRFDVWAAGLRRTVES